MPPDAASPPGARRAAAVANPTKHDDVAKLKTGERIGIRRGVERGRSIPGQADGLPQEPGVAEADGEDPGGAAGAHGADPGGASGAGGTRGA